MGGNKFILDYVQSCTAGNLKFSDCGPVWQMGIIATLLALAIIFLVALRFQPRGPSTQT